MNIVLKGLKQDTTKSWRAYDMCEKVEMIMY